VLRCSPAGFDVGSDRRHRSGRCSALFESSTSIVLLTVVPVGMWAKASISPLSELAREVLDVRPASDAIWCQWMEAPLLPYKLASVAYLAQPSQKLLLARHKGFEVDRFRLTLLPGQGVHPSKTR
jgi:hypothetical protein